MKATTNVLKTREVQYVLRKQLLPIKGTNLAYQIGKNLNKIDSFLDNIDKRIEELEKNFQVKDPEGKPVLFEIDETGTRFKLIGGHFVVAAEGAANARTRVDTKDPEFLEAIKNIEAEEFADYHAINETTISELATKGILDGVDLAVLIGNVIAQ